MSDQEEVLKRDDKKIPVIELFGPTLQGEGQLIGQQTFFLRLGGCDYRCAMCDSLHAVLPSEVKKNATWMTQEEVFNELTSRPNNACRFVTLSGGNPCMWPLDDLVHSLRTNSWRIAVETQGTIRPPWINLCHYVTISPKGPGMGEKFEVDKLDFFISHLFEHWTHPCLKVVIFDQRDIEFAKELAQKYLHLPMYLSLGNPTPPDNQKSWGGNDSAATAIELLDRMRMLWEDIKLEPTLARVRFTPQLHLLLWGNARGR